MKNKYLTACNIVRLSNFIIYYKNMRLEELGLTSTQYDAIKYILRNKEKKDMTACDLINNLNLSQSTIAGIISRLEEKEFITRKTDPSDTRKSLIFPTEKTLNLEISLRKIGDEIEDLLLNKLSLDQQSEFNKFLETSLENIETGINNFKENKNER